VEATSRRFTIGLSSGSDVSSLHDRTADEAAGCCFHSEATSRRFIHSWIVKRQDAASTPGRKTSLRYRITPSWFHALLDSARSLGGHEVDHGNPMKLRIVIALGLFAILATIGVTILESEDPLEASSADVGGSAVPIAEAPREAGVAFESGTAERVVAESDPRPVEVRAAITGVVVDRDGAPIAGARVVASRHREGLGATTTGKNGAFEIAWNVAESRAAVRILAAAEGFVTTAQNATFDQPSEIVLATAVRIAGRVVNAVTRVPVAGAEVRHAKSAIEVRSGEDGGFVLTDVDPAVDAELVASRDGYARGKLRVPRGSGASVSDLEIGLERGVAIRGVVVDRDTLAPLAGVAVVDWTTLSPRAARNLREGAGDASLLLDTPDGTIAVTDSGGAFVAHVAAHGRLHLEFQVASHLPLVWAAENTRFAADRALRIPLIAPAYIDGRVVAPGNRPVLGAFVRAVPNDGAAEIAAIATEAKRFGLEGRVQLEHRVPAATDAEGRTRIEVAPSPRPYAVVANHAAWVAFEAPVPVLATAGAVADVVIAVEAAGAITGRAMRGDSALAGIVRWRYPGGRYQQARMLDALRYRIDGVRAGPVELEVRSATTVLLTATVTAIGAQTVEHDLVIAQAGSTIEGRVTGSDGRPLAGVRVGSPMHPNFVATGADGAYSLTVFEGETYTIQAARGIQSAERSGVAAGATGIDFVLEDSGRVRARMLDAASGLPLRLPSPAPYAIEWRLLGTTRKAAFTVSALDADGAVEFEVPAGLLDIEFDFGTLGYLGQTVPGVLVAGGAPHAIEVELERGIEVELRIAPEEAPPKTHRAYLVRADAIEAFTAAGMDRPLPAADTWVGSTDPDHGGWRGFTFGAGGIAVLRGLKPGEYLLEILPRDHRVEPARIDLREPPQRPITLRRTKQ
jgi:hypothetical protein